MIFEVTHGYHHPAEDAMEDKVQIIGQKPPKQTNKKQEQLQSMMNGVTGELKASAYLNATDYIKTN